MLRLAALAKIEEETGFIWVELIVWWLGAIAATAAGCYEISLGLLGILVVYFYPKTGELGPCKL